jgi:glycosyltransferase involved in cell wall biosynthesis
VLISKLREQLSRPLHIIFLPSWYPVRDQPLNGIFNRELAILLSKEHQIDLLHLHFQPDLDHQAIMRNNEGGNFRETVVYLPGKGNRFFRQWEYVTCLFKKIKDIIRTNGKPDIVHVQVAWKMGLMAYLLRWRYGIPFVITEHYTGYLPQDGALRGWKKWASIFLLKRANAVTAVSDSLKKAIAVMGVPDVTVVPNRVDDVFFETKINEEKPTDKITFIHVSNFDDRQKQTSVIIRQFVQLHAKYPQTALMLLVPRKEWIAFIERNKNLDIAGILHLQPDDNRHIYVERMLKADVLISYSNYETFGLTVAESLCLGIPVIYTACGGPEYFVEKEMGMEVDPADANSLYGAMEKMVLEYHFDKKKIAERAREKLDRSKIVAAYNDVYNSILNK